MPGVFPFEDEYFDVLGKARAGLGFDLGELARRAGVDSDAIQALETGSADPDPDILGRVAAALELGSSRLVELALRPAPPPSRKLPALSFRVPADVPSAANTFIFACPSTRACAVVDPGSGGRAIKRLVDENRLEPSCIFLTHGHGDHCAALREVADALGVRAFALEAEKSVLYGREIDFVAPGYRIAVGDLEAAIDWVPGHTPGGAAVSVPSLGLVFSGDSLFARSVGRCRGSSSVYRRYLEAVRNAILELAPETTVCPGHGPMSSVGDERELNPFFP